jgi:hypothetical protein
MLIQEPQHSEAPCGARRRLALDLLETARRVLMQQA